MSVAKRTISLLQSCNVVGQSRKCFSCRTCMLPTTESQCLRSASVTHAHYLRGIRIGHFRSRSSPLLPSSWARVNYCFGVKYGHSGSNMTDEERDLPEEVEEILQSDEVQKDEELKKLVKEIAKDFNNEDEQIEQTPNETGDTSTVKAEETSWKLEPIDKDDKTPGGVFKIDELVEVLREENARDICVIKVPEERQYVDYFVIVSCRSTRHLQAMAQYVMQLFKQKKRSGDPFVRLEGKHNDDWMCIDFGHVVVHFFLPAAREMYELEKLWTLGPKYDDQLRYLAKQAAMMDTEIEVSFEDVIDPPR